MIIEALLITSCFAVTPLFCAYANLVRGGHFGRYLTDWVGENTGQRVMSGIVVMYGAIYLYIIAARPVIWDAVMYGIVIGLAYVLFYLPGWGAWFDIGTKEPEPDRGEEPMRTVYRVISRFAGDAWGDAAAMFVRGQPSALVFFLAAWANTHHIGTALVTGLICAQFFSVVWVLTFAAAHRWRAIEGNAADAFNGAAMGLLMAAAALIGD